MQLNDKIIKNILFLYFYYIFFIINKNIYLLNDINDCYDIIKI